MQYVNDIRFDALVGYSWNFYGIDNQTFVIGTDAHRCAFQVIEDQDDGYRSYLDHIEPVPLHTAIHSKTPIAEIVIVKEFNEFQSFDGFRFRDVTDGHIWLEVGTESYDSYYPVCVWNFYPRERKTT